LTNSPESFTILIVMMCRHWWLIETAKGQASEGKCKICGVVKHFRNTIFAETPQFVPDFVVTGKIKRRRRKKIEAKP